MLCFKRFSLSLTSLLVLCLAVCTLPGSNAQCASEVGCQGQASARSVSVSESDFVKRQHPKGLTNAERLGRGLPPLPPTRRSHQLLPRASPAPSVTYNGHVRISSGSTVLGYLAADPNYWTTLLVPDINSALRVSFSLPQGATSGSGLQLLQIDERGPLLGLVVGLDSSGSNIGPGSSNYLYFDPVSAPGTTAGATPQTFPSFLSTMTGSSDKTAETAVWSVDLSTSRIAVQWINTDETSPTTHTFVQSNHLYAGGDPTAFQGSFSAPIISVDLTFVLESSG